MTRFQMVTHRSFPLECHIASNYWVGVLVCRLISCRSMINRCTTASSSHLYSRRIVDAYQYSVSPSLDFPIISVWERRESRFLYLCTKFPPRQLFCKHCDVYFPSARNIERPSLIPTMTQNRPYKGTNSVEISDYSA